MAPAPELRHSCRRKNTRPPRWPRLFTTRVSWLRRKRAHQPSTFTHQPCRPTCFRVRLRFGVRLSSAAFRHRTASRAESARGLAHSKSSALPQHQWFAGLIGAKPELRHSCRRKNTRPARWPRLFTTRVSWLRRKRAHQPCRLHNRWPYRDRPHRCRACSGAI